MNLRTVLSLLALLGLLVTASAAPIGAAQAEPERGEILKIAINGPIQDPTNMNMTNWSADRANTGLHEVAYEYFFYNNLQTGEFIPWLAESFEYNDDATSLTVKLRDGVTWNDGEPFTADDVVFTYDIMRENPSMSWAVEASEAVASVEKVDDLTVTFNLSSPNPRFHLYREAFPAVGIWGGITILPKHIWENEDPLTFKNNPPVTTGPYRLKEATQSSVVWERRDDWWATDILGVTPGPREVQSSTSGRRATSPKPWSTMSWIRRISASSPPAPFRRSPGGTRTSALGRRSPRFLGPIPARA